jgi:glycosyltransferase involved in cell wall biosynthesis
VAKVLYLSYDGMTDPLGQSQILSYLTALSSQGHQITLISFEKKEKENLFRTIKTQLSDFSIQWFPLRYHKNPAVLSTLYDLWQMYRLARKIILKSQVEMIHSRSYPSSYVALRLKRKTGLPYIFDMRGFWADERVEGNLWPLSNPLYRLIYHFFKQKEQQMLREAAAVVSLTDNARQWLIHQWHHNASRTPVVVIPCCCDTRLFNPSPPKIKEEQRQRLHIPTDAYVLVYSGSVGTWYLLDEMMQFFQALSAIKPEAWFLFITPHEQALILKKAASYGIKNLRIISAQWKEVPQWLAAADAAVYFIKPCFSKKASSPVKQAEIMAAGLPLVTNSGIGDSDILFADGIAGVLIHDFKPETLQNAAMQLLSRPFNPMDIRQRALQHFSLEKAVEAYSDLYDYITAPTDDGSSHHV